MHRPRVTTQAAEGMPRRAWRVAEIEQMVAAGIIPADERFELIGGEVVPMSPKGHHHEVLKAALQDYWVPLLKGSATRLLMESTLRTGEHDVLEPDLVFWPRVVPIKDLRPGVITFLVEIADSSLAYDLGGKAARYAALGIVEYWVINAVRLATRMHRLPGAGGYGAIRNCDAGDLLAPISHPELAVRLSDLDLR